jgi:transcriptional regulator with XRE-family HTH domain
LRLLLGAHLRRLREAQGITQGDAARSIQASEATLHGFEQGVGGLAPGDLATLLTTYGVDEPEDRERLAELVDNLASPRGWWHRQGDVLPSWFRSYLGVEAAAESIRVYEPQFIPAILRTTDYARHIAHLDPTEPTQAEIQRRVDLHAARLQALTHDRSVRIWAVVEEAALRRRVGDISVMRGQIQTLLDNLQRPHVAIQVLPRQQAVLAVGAGFSILRFPHPDTFDLVCIEQLTSAIYLEQRSDLDHYLAAMEQLCLKANPPDQTADTLRVILNELAA